jgi:hypothetical protein
MWGEGDVVGVMDNAGFSSCYSVVSGE